MFYNCILYRALKNEKLFNINCLFYIFFRELSEANISRRNLQNSLRDVMGNESRCVDKFQHDILAHGPEVLFCSFSCRRILERSSPRRTWEQPAMVNYHLKEDGGSLKYRDPKESTRRFW